MKRDDAKAAAEAAGATVGGSVSGNTDVLVCGTGVGAKKTDDAAKKGVDVWTEDHFNAVLAGGGGAGDSVRGLCAAGCCHTGFGGSDTGGPARLIGAA